MFAGVERGPVPIWRELRTRRNSARKLDAGARRNRRPRARCAACARAAGFSMVDGGGGVPPWANAADVRMARLLAEPVHSHGRDPRKRARGRRGATATVDSAPSKRDRRSIGRPISIWITTASMKSATIWASGPRSAAEARGAPNWFHRRRSSASVPGLSRRSGKIAVRRTQAASDDKAENEAEARGGNGSRAGQLPAVEGVAAASVNRSRAGSSGRSGQPRRKIAGGTGDSAGRFGHIGSDG